MKLSILIPTLPGREEMLRIVSCAHVAQHPDCEILTTTGYSWGEGLNQLAKKAKGDYWLCACDDILPHQGWFYAARAVVDQGLTPATRYWDMDEEPLRPGTDDAVGGSRVDWCRSFLLTEEIYSDVGPLIDATWYADVDYSERLRESGREIIACDGFSFTHLDGDRDWLTEAEDHRQWRLYQESQEVRRAVA